MFNLPGGDCEPREKWWVRAGCWLQERVKPLCEKDGDRLTAANRMGIGLHKVFTAFTKCGCCHGYRVLVVLAIGGIAGMLHPAVFGLAIGTLLALGYIAGR